MKNAIKYLMLAGVLSLSVGVQAKVCSASSEWWPYCNDQATGPDEGSAEWYRCQARGGCQ